VIFRVGYVGDDLIVLADSAEEAVRKANDAAARAREAYTRRHGNALPAKVYTYAREVRLTPEGVER
jgi:hypothetical protein